VLRPHPAHYGEAEQWLTVQDLIVQRQIELNPLGEGLVENLLRLRPICVLASVTGAMVEVALSGWPLGVILSNWLPDYAPLTAMLAGTVFSSHNADEVKAWIERLWGDNDYRYAYSQICETAAQRHIEKTGTAAATALVEIL